ncbi:alpha/beta hydrolase [Hymenobacter negativus]|uniref:Proline iminopeptidase n=1 Tax=Hymenobacter negativus TaxID=2795026 RepID=A0ABS3QJI5_9BACT|nr:alpha/beta hydrolase [Hymenobacter negativus]MBO2011178.1 alpha/beta hydrolase [Hymenobacter negativus]
MPRFLLLVLLLVPLLCPPASSQTYQPRIEPVVCPIKVDKRLVVTYGYLVVPENRLRPTGRQVKIPFLFVRRPTQDPTQNVSLYSTGGPGYSTIANIDSIGYRSGWLKYGGIILFDQRGTRRAQPCLDCPQVPAAVRQSYRTGLSQDSLVRVAVRQCRDQFVRQGIDLSAYTTIASAADIADLRQALHLAPLTLVGISYSGSLMLTVARNHPESVRALLLNSPLPGYTNYEEAGLLNINEALAQVFTDCERDSAAHPAYGQLRRRFQQYFTAITGKKFTLRYRPPGTLDSLRITYTKKELLDAVLDRLTAQQVHTIPEVLLDMLAGRHQTYVREQVDAAFAGDPAVSLGMRYSVYCSEQIAYAAPSLVARQALVVPWLAGYPFNNVDHEICRCWQVQPEPPVAKTPVYSRVPVLLTGGDIDPWCRPFYNQLIRRYLPNCQVLLVHRRGHAPGYTVGGVDYAELFLAHPYQPLHAQSTELEID